MRKPQSLTNSRVLDPKNQLPKPGQLEVRGIVATVNIHQSLTMLPFTSPKKYLGGGGDNVYSSNPIKTLK
jgi:hypothetical protein